MSPVKDEGKRAVKARATRGKIVDAARELFVEHGYGATNLQDVADRAGVAVQTIYFVFRNKRALLKELVDTTIAGDDAPIATMDRPWFRNALAAETAEEHLRAHVRGTAAVLARVAPIMKMLEAAATTDPEIVELWPAESDPRYVVQTAAAESLITKEGARQDITARHAADMLYAMLSPELYLLLVRDRGWGARRWEHWVLDTLRPQLCAAWLG
ncbi:TetR family transcriptional regulator [Herbihabitans rhizosphaerae]|uniref:TetR family transcriptional regulator n=1 Tax=Herbihabitans rhizosphaerae TaxID=1872711 RepID=A0A4Q7KQX3_9PSEU|nr:TetR/AcrR family transcriptional regulator [Herbihabitans rhizosphaerae]RZS38874.1 TetR family transcriptional regulator [Herbihabitans rhizosphaerae]